MGGSSATLDLIVRLGATDGRADTAQALARVLGVDELLLFVRDGELDVLLPARGFPRTIRGGARWRAFLAGCTTPGRHAGEVDLPEDTVRRALALTSGRAVAVLLGGRPDEPLVGLFYRTMPLVGALLAAENDLGLARLSSDIAAGEATRSRSLADALDAARARETTLNAELVDEHRRRDEFLAMLAHELRNPLAPLVTTVGLLRTRTADATTHLDLMSRQIAQLARLLESLLDASRVRQGQIELRNEPLSLGDVLESALTSARPLLDARRQTAELTSDGDTLPVIGDRVRLTQVFFTLLQNAARYTHHGGHIGLVASREGDFGRVQVTDNGVGLAPDMLRRVFDFFAQAPGASDPSQGGLGIELMLAKSLVELHGGTLGADSAGSGHGSTFTVRLPLSSSMAPARVAPVECDDVPAADHRARVLAVDDNHDNADSLAVLLRTFGHDVDVAYGARQALELAATADFDLCLVDIGLPEIDGYELARRLRELQPGARLVAFTGYGSDEDRRRTAEAGFDEHLVKPATIEVLSALAAQAGGAAGRKDE